MTTIRVTTTGRTYLERFSQLQHVGDPVHVFRDPAKPGAGVSRPALDRLLADGLVKLGEHVPGKGRPVVVTALGRTCLDLVEAGAVVNSAQLHYREATRHLDNAAHAVGEDLGTPEDLSVLLTAAVHGLLAVTAALQDLAQQADAQPEAIAEAVGVLRILPDRR